MKLLHFTLVIVALLAPLYVLGCVGSYEAGHLPLLRMVVHCGASLAAQWGSIFAAHKMSGIWEAEK